MRWIRRHIQSGAWLAQIALALHLVLTFGHVHAEQHSPAWMITAPVITATDADADEGGGSAPGQRYRILPAHHFCAVCSNISLLGVSVVPVAQTLAPTCAVIGIIEPDFTDVAPPLEARSSFKARAPPSA
jgi:hypothetical protein